MLRLCCLLVLTLPVPVVAGPAEDLRHLVEKSRQAWDVPGCAVVVVKEDAVMLLEGFGVRELGKQEKVTPDTLFGIGSLTKAMTATTLARLVEEGKLDWDDPVRKHVPYFRLRDPLADREVTIRDLLCHRTGLARHDLLWRSAPWSLEESVRRMAHLEPDASFRSRYGYNNLTYIALGLVIESASKMPWHEYATRHLFRPLDMNGVVFTRSDLVKARDRSSPHQLGDDDKTVRVIDWYDDDRQIRASGSVKASARDMGNWLRFHLASGVWQGKQVVARDRLEETYRPQIVTPVRSLLVSEAGTTQGAYALGWHVRDHRGHQLLEHGGSVDGFLVYQCLVPKRRVGVTVLGNLGGSGMPTALCYTLLDRVLELPAKDWDSLLRKAQANDREQARKREETWLARRQPDTKPSRELLVYEGEYRHPAYGKAEVRRVDERLEITWGGFKERLKHFHHDTFTVPGKSRIQHESVSFTLGSEGEVIRFRFLGQDFKRVKK